jgi:hypothetical protein
MLRAIECSRVCVYLAVFAGVIGCAGMAAADLVTNGDFTTDATGWMSAGLFGRADGTESPEHPSAAGGTVPSPGGPSAWFFGNAWMYQFPTIPLVAGQTYKFSFLASLTVGNGVAADETLIAHVYDHGTNTELKGVTTRLILNTWNQYSVQFTPTAAVNSYSVGFLNSKDPVWSPLDACGFGLDSISLTVVPEPSVLVLSITGLFGLLAYAWRRRK